MKENYCINSKIVLNSAIKSSQKKFEDFQINPNVIILGIGFEVKLLDFIIPTHSLGSDGTSVFYGRKSNEKGIINEDIVKILIEISSKKSIDVHIGKNYSMEAFYRISKESINKLREEGIISMENGELNILNTICNNVGVKFGALFYSYINLLKGWKIPWMNSDLYRSVVEMEVNIALETFLKLES
ncbi:MAG: hypothetical protein P8Y97_03465 [Candidatus Lokiarchaeota archaeon]